MEQNNLPYALTLLIISNQCHFSDTTAIYILTICELSQEVQYNFNQTQFLSTFLRPMLNRLTSQLRCVPKLAFKNVYYRTARKTNKDLYELLGVSRSADAKQIKKAYYKLAQQLHPDKNPSPEAKQKFTQVNNAYEILSDSSKRQMYDQTGNTGEGNAAEYNSEHGGFNPEDIFSQFKGFNQGGRGQAGGFEDILKSMFEGGGFGGQTRGGRTQRQEEYTTMNLTIGFEQSVKGCTKVVQFERKCTCSTCRGSRCKPGTQPQKCRTCDGSGMQTVRQGIFAMSTTCGSCGGAGQKIKHFCSSCNGNGVEKKRVKEQIEIPRGISDGMVLKLLKKGNFEGDLIIKVQVKRSYVYGRQGSNSVTDMQISVLDAILGCEKELITIEGNKKKIKIPQGSQHGDKVTVKDQGFYMVNSSNKGDHIITLKISIPKSVTAQQRVLYEKIREVAK